ncbi:MAG: GNAT family N-acetyltransferase, partial [ANME-2 cluster archaeon]|nr:GNAT family N-acetyltransferase [ANME-2 cluster archaeon]
VTLKTDRSLERAISMYNKHGFSVVREDINTLFFRMES